MRYPDYDRGTLSITASILNYYGLETGYPTLPEIDKALESKPRNILLVLLDGMGENLLRRKLKADDFIVRHDAAAISAVFPSTTTAATTSLWTGLSPLEHGWLGWSLYFKEAGRMVDTFINRDSFTRDEYTATNLGITYMPLPSTFDRLRGKVETHAVFPFPSYSTQGVDHPHVAADFADQAKIAVDVCNKPGNHFMVIYNGEPDHTMHEKGVECPETQANFERLNRLVENMCAQLDGDTQVILTADHGLIDVTEMVELTDYPELIECLWMPTSVEMRAAAFYVKPHKREQFEREFKKICGDDFLLLTREEVLKTNLLGRGTVHKKSDDFMGDYLACATGTRYLHYNTPASKPVSLIGQHAGLTEDEMTVPVVLFR